MAADVPVAYDDLEHSDSRLTQAHAYFSAVIGEWVEARGKDEIESRCQQITHVLTDGLQLVVIQLRTDEDSQEIFETLNARAAQSAKRDADLKAQVAQVQTSLEQSAVDLRAHTTRVSTGTIQLQLFGIFLVGLGACLAVVPTVFGLE